MRGLVGAVRYHGLDFGVLFYQSVIYIVKRYAVMYIAGGYFYFQNIAVLVAGGVGFIGHLFLMVAFYKHSRIRICSAFGYYFLLGFLFALFQFLPGGIIPFLLGRFRHIVVILILFCSKGLLSVGFPVGVYFLHKFLGIPFCFHLHLFLGHFLVVGIGFDVGAIYKDRVGVKITGFCYLAENPVENLIYSLRGKAMLEIIADGGEMGCFFLQTVAEKPTICHIQRNFFRCPAQRGQAIQMLNEYHFEQHNRVDAGSAIILTIQRLHHIVELVPVNCRIDFAQQMLRRHQTFGVHDFVYSSFHFSTFQHFSSPMIIIS